MASNEDQLKCFDENAILIQRSPTGRGFRLETSQLLPYPREQVFELFSDAFQLEAITPEWLHFHVVTPRPIQIEQGTLIDYRLRLRGIPIRWRSRISVWEPPFRFVDEQLRGPYRFWYHEHTFEAVDGGTMCHDVVDYGVYGGAVINALAVRRDLLKIFAFRRRKIAEAFSALTSS
jgi:ligand-binding SRPBCC domain-containing protein